MKRTSYEILRMLSVYDNGIGQFEMLYEDEEKVVQISKNGYKIIQIYHDKYAVLQNGNNEIVLAKVISDE